MKVGSLISSHEPARKEGGNEVRKESYWSQSSDGWLSRSLSTNGKKHALNWLDKQREERSLVANRPASLLPPSEGVHLGGVLDGGNPD